MPGAGFQLHQIAVEGVSRSHPLRALRALARAAMAVPRSRSLLRSLEADAVLGGGGYVSAPVGLAALSLRVPLVLSEADSHLGLSNRLLARFARRVCLAFPIEGRAAPRYLVTGRPVPAVRCDREAARRRFGIPAQARCVLVFGGSLGARSINLAAARGVRRRPLPRAAHLRQPRPRRAGRARAAARLRPARVPRRGALRGGARRRRPGRRPRRGVGVRARRPRAAGGARALPARRGRPPDRQRPLDGTGGGGGDGGRRRARRPPGSRARSRGCWTTGCAWRRWPTPRARWPVPMPPARWPASCWRRRRDERGRRAVGRGDACISWASAAPV